VSSAEARRAIAAAAVALAFAHPQAASADGDPPSDILISEEVYFAYQPKASAVVAQALRTTLKRTRAAGYRLRVAIVGTPIDLGSVPELFGKPQQYADFLAPEIAFQYKGALLVVMPAGYGIHNAGKKAAQALTDLGAPSGDGADALPRAAIKAAVALSKAAGHPVAAPKLAGGGGGSSALVPVAVLVGMLVLGTCLVMWKRRAS